MSEKRPYMVEPDFLERVDDHERRLEVLEHDWEEELAKEDKGRTWDVGCGWLIAIWIIAIAVYEIAKLFAK